MKLRYVLSLGLVILMAGAVHPAKLVTLLPHAKQSLAFLAHGNSGIIIGLAAGERGGLSLFTFKGDRVGRSGTIAKGTARNAPDLPVKFFRTSDGKFVSVIEVFVTDGARARGTIALVKLDTKSRELWFRSFGEAGLDYKPIDCVQTADGGFLIAGATVQNAAIWNSLLVRTDANGNQIWKKVIPASSYSSFDQIITLSDGGFVLYGYDRLQDSVNIRILKVTANGDLVWQRTFPGKGDSLTRPVLTGRGGQIFFQVKSENAVPVMVLLGADGTLGIPAPVTGIVATAEFEDAFSLDDGSFILCGHTGGNAGNVLLARWRPGAGLVWQKSINVDGTDIGKFVRLAPDGGYYVYAVTGYGYNYSTQKYTYKNTVIKTDRQGNTLWHESFTIGLTDNVRDMHVLPDGRVVLLLSTIKDGKEGGYVLFSEAGGRPGVR